MANPQPTDAHLRVAHSINEAIMLRDFTKRQRKILDLILRLSWGCGKKYAYIPQQNDFEVVGLYEGDIKQELEWLEVSKIIGRDGPYYWFNKDFDQWQISRIHQFSPERLSKLLSVNLNGSSPPVSDLLSNHPKLSKILSPLSKTLSDDLVKHEVRTSQNTKSSTTNLALPKEILNKYIYKDNTEISILLSSYPEITKKAMEIWEEVKDDLKLQVNASNYQTWLERTSGVFIDGNTLVVGVPSFFVFEYLVKNQMQLFERTLKGFGDYEVQFIIQEAKE